MRYHWLLLAGLALAACSASAAGNGDAAVEDGATLDAAGAADAGDAADATHPVDDADATHPADDADAVAADGGVTPAAPAPPAYGIFQLYGDEYAGFRQAMDFSLQDYWDFVDDHVARLGVRYTRTNTLLIWGLVEPELGGGYVFDGPMRGDEVIQATFAPAEGKEMDILVVIDPNRGERGAADIPIPERADEYQAFVRAAVERYDGDGVDDLAGTRVRDWQVMNEPVGLINRGQLDVATYVELVRLTAEAVHAADPDARLVLGDLGPFLREVLPLVPVDVAIHAVDTHWWPDSADRYDHPFVATIRANLDASARADTAIWMTEFGIHVNQPEDLPRHSPEEQATWLVKAMVSARARGASRILWNNLAAWTSFNGDPGSRFNFMGLVSGGDSSGDPADDVGRERVAWYAYQRLVATTGTREAELVGEVAGFPDGVRVTEFRRRDDGASRFVAWHDEGDIEIDLPCPAAECAIVGLIPASDGTFQTERRPSVGGIVAVPLGPLPVLVDSQ